MYREDRTVYLVMEFLPGKNLKYLWFELEEEDKLSVAVGLNAICNQMRPLLFPGYFGNLSRGPYRHRFFMIMDPDPFMNGPFESSAQVGLALARCSQDNWNLNNRGGFISERFARHLLTAFGGYESVFIHADLHPQDTLVREEITGAGEEQQWWTGNRRAGIQISGDMWNPLLTLAGRMTGSKSTSLS
jgi:hypothetical protein